MQNPKLIYTVTYNTTKRFTPELVAAIFAKVPAYDPSPIDRHIVLEKSSTDGKGNSIFELYKEELSAEEQDFYNRFFTMMRSHESYCDIHPDWNCMGHYYCWSEREIQDLYTTLRDSK